MNLTGVIIDAYVLITILIIVCIHSGGGGLMHKMKMMKMMKDHHEDQHKGITIGFKAFKVPIPIPVAMPYVEPQTMMMKGNKGMKKGKGQMMLKMMDMHMKMKMMKMITKMKMKEMKMTKMKGMKCKPKCMMMKMMKAKCEHECPEAACPQIMDSSCNSCPEMKGDWPTAMMMNNGWPEMMNNGWPAMMNNGWPSPAMMMNKGWPSPMMKGMMKAMCPECPPCDEPEVEMEPDYYEEELEEDQNAWDTNLVPVYQRMNDKAKGDNFDEAFFYTFDKHLRAFKIPLRQDSKSLESVQRRDIDFDY